MKNTREVMKKVLSIMVLMILMLNSSALTIISKAVDAVQQEETQEEKAKAKVDVEIEKYVNYALTEENKGTVLQAKIQTGIEYKEGEEYKPLKASGVVMTSPKIAGEYPESVYVIAKSTKATNGRRENNKEANYEYDKETGILKIMAVNVENENGEIYSEQDTNAKDVYEVIYYYSPNCYTEEKQEREIEITGKVVEQIYDENETTITADINKKEVVTENKKDLISTSIETSSIYNGAIKANQENGAQEQTTYKEKLQVEVIYKDLAEEVTINTKNKFVNTQNEETETEEIIYKNTKLIKQNVLDILGEEGKLEIQNQAGETIKEINKDTETNEQGIVEINYENEEKQIIIKTTKPIKQGTIEIENERTIKETIKDTQINKIKEETTITSKNDTQEIRKYEDQKEIELKESTSKIDLSIDKNELTNKISNDVILTAVLKTNNIKYNLYKNPTIEIEMPNEVDKIILGDASILYDDQLKIKNTQVENNKIKIELEGTQTQYIESSSMYEGATITIPATIIVKTDIESTKTNIKTRYTNETGTISYEKEGKESEELEINIDSMNQPKIMTIAEPVAAQGEVANGLAIEVTAQVGNDVLEDNATVYEEEVINYTVKVTNTTESAIENINITGNVPEGTTYVTKDGSVQNPNRDESEDIKFNELFKRETNKKEETFTIESLGARETKTNTYKVMVNKLENTEEKQIQATIKTKIDDTEVNSKTINSVAKNAKLSIGIYPGLKSFNINSKYSWNFTIEVTNKTNETINDAIVELNIPDEMKMLENEDYKLIYDETTNKVKYSIDEINANSKCQFVVSMAAVNFEEEKNEYHIPISAKVYFNDSEEYRADIEQVTAYSTNISIIKSSPTEGQKLESLQEIEYDITVTNNGLVDAWIDIIDNMPEGIEATEAEYEMFEKNEETGKYDKVTKTKSLTSKLESETDDFKLETVILHGESLKIKIFANVEPMDKIIEIENVAMVTVDGIETKLSNSVENTILPYGYDPDDDDDEDPDEPTNPEDPNNPTDPENPNNPTDPENPNDPNNPPKSTNGNINGTVWIDSNKDGKRDDDEETLSGVTVKLFNAQKGSIVTDKNGNKKIATTDKDGNYEFAELENGEYLILFEYDTNTYEITTYQKNGISEKLNSDVIKKEVSIDGDIKQVGVTDALIILNNDLNNIDMGLIKNPTFDFKLDKYVSKITVINSKGTNEKTFDNKKLAKIEIPAKQLNNSTVQIEYKIVVTNEGEVDGYINEITDYIPEGLAFNSLNNSNWNMSVNGILKNTSLSNERIKPGESKEVTLILTKNMTESSTGTITNYAEIGEISNSRSLLDNDSTPANKVDGEDDYSKAEVIIGIKTGIVTYIVLIMITLCIIAIYMYLIKNNKVNKKMIHIFMFSILTIIALIYFTNIAIASAITPSVTDTVGGDPITINFDDLEYHVENGTWANTNRPNHGGYWCLDPGYSLFTNDQKRYIGIKNSFTSADEAKAYFESNGLPYNGELQTMMDNCFSKIKDPSIEIDSITSKDAKITEKKNRKGEVDYYLYGPYEVNYTATDCSTITGTLQTCKLSGKSVSGTITNSSGSEITNISNGGKIYIKIDETGGDLTFKLKLSSENVSYTGVKVNLHYYEHYRSKKNKPYNQDLAKFTEEDTSSNATDSYTKNASFTGSLRIIKVDKDDFNNSQETNYNKKVEAITIYGAKVKIKGKNNDYEKIVTLSKKNGGEKTIKNLEPGTYIVEEIQAPIRNHDGDTVSYYNLNLQEDSDIKVEVDVEIKRDGSPTRKTLKNQAHGKIQIIKHGEDDQPLAGAKFIVQCTKSNNSTVKDKYVKGDKDITTYKNYNDAINYAYFTTNTNGIAVIDNLPPGDYLVQEIEAAPGYDLDLQSVTSILVSVTAKGTAKAEFIGDKRNRQYGNLEINKQDEDTKTALAGVGFKIKNSIGSYLSVNSATNLTGTVTLSPPNVTLTSAGYGYSFQSGNASIFYTGSDGKIIIKNLPIDTYSAEEVSMPADLQDYYEVTNNNFPSTKLTTNTSGNTPLTISNKQKWVGIKGYVWQDEGGYDKDQSKYSNNNLWDTSEKKIQGITVKLVDNNGNIVTKKDNAGNTVNQETITNENGEYSFGKVEIDSLENYHIEFTYDGFTYTSVQTGKESNASKAKENYKSRRNINNKFNEVTKGKTGSGINLNYDTKTENNITNARYKNEVWIYGTTNNVITAEKISDTYDTIATTMDAGYVLERGKGDKQYIISDINLGLKTREMPNALIYAHDIDNVKVQINGHTSVYKYGKNSVSADMDNLENGQLVSRFSSYKRAIYPSYIRSIDDLQKSDNELKIYVTYKITLQNASNTLAMSINKLTNYYDKKYMGDNISIGTEIETNIDSDNYYGLKGGNNLQYEDVNLGSIDNVLGLYNNRGTSLPWARDDYNAMIISGKDDEPIVSLDASTSEDIYIQYEVNRENIKQILNGEPTFNNIVEIFSYTTYYGKLTEKDTAPDRERDVYAAVDNDSAAGNSTPDSNNKENDTYISPTIQLTVGDEKVITGNVYEDLPDYQDSNLNAENTNTGEERKGNGIYDTNESSVQNVLVELIPEENIEGETALKNDNGTAYIYPNTQGNDSTRYLGTINTNEHNKAIAVTYTEPDGSYSFNGVIPGHYKVKFTYGEKVQYKEYGDTVHNTTINDGKNTKVTVQDYKSTIRTGNIYKKEETKEDDEYWYQNEPDIRYSDALDDWTTRKDINRALSNITNKTVTNYKGGILENFQDYSMTASTDTMDIAIQDTEKEVIEYIENETNEPTGVTKNVDFGIIERPRQEIEITKEISYIKLTLASGQVIIDGDPRTDKLPYVTYLTDNKKPISQLKLEIDNEIIHGSTLQVQYCIKVNNLSEIDYNDEEYYKTGKQSNASILVKTSVTQLVDYLDNELATTYTYDDTTNDWYKLDNDDVDNLKNNGLITDDVHSEAQKYNTILLLNNDDSGNLANMAPGDVREITVNSSKLLSNTTDDLVFKNDIEVLGEKNIVGRFMHSSTPGNYIPQGDTIKENDDNHKGNEGIDDTNPPIGPNHSIIIEDKNIISTITIVPPTGQTRIYYVIGAVCLLILTTGIIIIKKKVLKS